MIAVAWLAGRGDLAAEPAQPSLPDAIQLLADITLIDRDCRDTAVDFGRAFQVAEAMGLSASDVMPAGALRPQFEAATRTRLARTSHDELCAAVARAYGDHVPGLLKTR